jgi:hypothetical protein
LQNISPVHDLTSLLFMIHFNNILSLHLDLQRSHFPFRVSDRILNEFPMHAVCSNSFIFLDSFFSTV